MSTSTDGILAYGYDMGETFGISYDQPEPAWVSEGDSYSDDAARALFAAVGKVFGPGEYFDPDKLMEACGVEFVYHCSDRCPMYILAAKHIEAYRGSPKAVDFTVPEGADERLTWALDVLGITPPTERPQWLLASWWG